MADKYSLFVDLDSLNVLYKCGDKFVTALSHSSGIDRLCEIAPSFGAGFDIYLCLKPRAPGEGDLVINELSIVGLPFTVDSEELYQVLKYFRDFRGFGEVYLCNWVNNYIQSARVQTFSSVVYYGDRVAKLEVKDGTLTDFSLYGSQREFEETSGSEYQGYGDVGLIDVDGFKAQYAEFSSASKAQITALAPLAHCYRTGLRMETGELFEKLKSSHEGGPKVINTYIKREHKPAPVVADPNLMPKDVEEKPELVPDEGSKDILSEVPRRRTPLAAKLLATVTCLLALSVGVCFGITSKNPGPPNYSSYINQVQERVAQIAKLETVFTQASTFTTKTVEYLQFCQSSAVPITLLGFERSGEEFVIRYSCVSESDCQLFTDYVAEDYIITSSNSLGVAEVEGQTVYQYSLSFS